jgi:single-stranded DNA-binding protein
MTSYNRVILTGTVATPPQYHYRPDGSPVIQFPLELDETKDLPDQEQPQADRRSPLNHRGPRRTPNRAGSGGLIHIVATGKLAEVKPGLQSGQHLLVVGKLNQRSWKTPEGRNRTRTEVIATDLRAIEKTQSNVCLFKRGEEHEETG